MRKPQSHESPHGFHRGCGGRIILNRSTRRLKLRTVVYEYLMCADCRTRVMDADIVSNREDFTIQQKSGTRGARRPKYDIKNWKDVK